MTPLLILLLIAPALSTPRAADRLRALITTTPSSKCEIMTVDTCDEMDYRLTMTNTFGHSQDEAEREMKKKLLVFRSQCSTDMRFFICSMFVPKCVVGQTTPALPCCSFCRRVEQDCSGPLKRWQSEFDCSKLPVGDNCVAPRNSIRNKRGVIDEIRREVQRGSLNNNYNNGRGNNNNYHDNSNYHRGDLDLDDLPRNHQHRGGLTYDRDFDDRQDEREDLRDDLRRRLNGRG